MPRRAEATSVPNVPEGQDVAPGRIYAAGLGLLVLIAVILGGLWLLYGNVSSGPAIGLARPDPAADLAGFRSHEEAELQTLGWIDRGKGIARIPVSDALQIIAARGKLPEWPTALSGDQDCTFLEGAVPRSPAAINCAMGWSEWSGRGQ